MAYLVIPTRNGHAVAKVVGPGEGAYITAEAVKAHGEGPFTVDGLTHTLGDYLPKPNLYRMSEGTQ